MPIPSVRPPLTPLAASACEHERQPQMSARRVDATVATKPHRHGPDAPDHPRPMGILPRAGVHIAAEPEGNRFDTVLGHKLCRYGRGSTPRPPPSSGFPRGVRRRCRPSQGQRSSGWSTPHSRMSPALQDCHARYPVVQGGGCCVMRLLAQGIMGIRREPEQPALWRLLEDRRGGSAWAEVMRQMMTW